MSMDIYEFLEKLPDLIDQHGCSAIASYLDDNFVWNQYEFGDQLSRICHNLRCGEITIAIEYADGILGTKRSCSKVVIDGVFKL